MATLAKRPDMNKRRPHRILVAALALLLISGGAWSGCPETGAGAVAAAAQALPAHCQGMEAHHTGEGRLSADCASTCPGYALGAVVGEALIKAEKPTPDFPLFAAAGHNHSVQRVPRVLARIWPRVAPPPVLPVTLVQLRVLLLG